MKKFEVNNKESLKYAVLWIGVLILFTWMLVNLQAVLKFLGKILSWFSPVLIGAAIAFVINVVMRPLEKLWAKKVKATKTSKKLKRPVCLALSTIIVLGLIFAVVFMLIPGLQQSAQDFMDNIPTYSEKANGWISRLAVIAGKYKISLPEFNGDPETILSKIKEYSGYFGTGILNKTLDATTSFFSGLVNTLLGLVFAVYLLAEKEKVCYHLKMLLLKLASPEKAGRILKVVNLSNQTFTNFISGQLIDASILGVMCFIGMLILRLPYAVVVSVLIAFTALIPVFGAWIGGGISTFLILLSNPMDAVWFLILLLVVQQLEGNLIYPKVVGKSIGLPGILVLISVTVGGSAFGVLGMLVGIPACAVVYSLYKDYMSKDGKVSGQPAENSKVS